MDIVWSTTLFGAKWVIIGLIYLALFVVLVSVRREMRGQLTGKIETPSVAAGRLKVIQAGTDPRIQPGMLLALAHETTLGAAEDNDLVLADHYISGRHARLRWDGAEWQLEDLGSRNGTLVNGRQALPHREQAVPFGATLAIGDMVFELLE